MARRSTRQRSPESAQDYPPGHFTELMRRHNWPPRFESAIPRVSDWRSGASASARVSAQREAGYEAGHWWATGTVQMPGTRDAAKPAWMPRSAR